jgi:hypothetical protein
MSWNTSLIVAVLLILALLIGGRWLRGNTEEPASARNPWLDREVTTHEELRAEINELISDNARGDITAEKLRKVMLDIEKVR